MTHRCVAARSASVGPRPRRAAGLDFIGPHGLVDARAGSAAPSVAVGALGRWGTSPELGRWQTNGRYRADSRMLLVRRELAGAASVAHGRRPTRLQRLIWVPIHRNSRPAVVAHSTSVLGLGYADVIDRQTRASVTAGPIDVRTEHDLPHHTSWEYAERARLVGPLPPSVPRRASRHVGGEQTLAAADGRHAALSLMADGPRGVSLKLVSLVPAARIVRLTRMRGAGSVTPATRSISP